MNKEYFSRTINLIAQFKTERKAMKKKKPSRFNRDGSDILKL